VKKVLVVDDSLTVRSEVAEALKPMGFDVLQAANASEAFASLARHSDVSLVILDVNMPGMSGIEALEHMRREGAHPGLPVVMLTTEAERSLVDRAKKAGAKGWLLKPVKPHLISSTVTRLVR
jgi:two-component system, chemotaxis family, chemotaxis protein CheY